VDVPVRDPPLEDVGLHDPRRERFFLFLLVLDLDEPALADSLGERPDEALFGAVELGLRGLGEIHLAEGLLELAADAVERRVGVGGDHRAHELECEPDRAGLERRQPRG
jgi:hypothetical protein